MYQKGKTLDEIEYTFEETCSEEEFNTVLNVLSWLDGEDDEYDD